MKGGVSVASVARDEKYFLPRFLPFFAFEIIQNKVLLYME
jgi:hypothetical protein